MFFRRRILSNTRRLLTVSLCTALASGTLGASQAVEAVLDRAGDPNWVGAFLLDGPKEEAKPVLTLPRGEKVRVWPARGENGYLYVERLSPGGAVTRSGFVHRKFLKLPQEAAAMSSAATPRTPAQTAAPQVPAKPSTPAPGTTAKATAAVKPATTAKAAPEKKADAGAVPSNSSALQEKLQALEAKLEVMEKRLSALERDGIPDPGVDFLQRLQKLEMEVHSRDTSSLPTVPFPEVPRHDSNHAPASAASRIPGVSWLLGSW